MRHSLGPHVVGQRIVVRRILRGETGPSGGPALTDLLGVCVSWAGDACVVQPETGPPVVIATADIVSGKPVPPRPSPRLRISPTDAQRRATALFPRLETEPLGGWTLRHSPTHTARRAGSVLALQAHGTGTCDGAADGGADGAADGAADDDAHDAVVAWYAARGRRPIAAVLRGSAEEALFVDRGWVAESGDADTVFALAGVASASRAAGDVRAPDDVELDEDGDLLTARLGDRASGVAALDGDWVGYRSVVVAPDHRRQGLGVVLMATLLEWSAARGATTAYLQVLGDNAAALTLYARLRFVEHHRYRYLAAPR